MHNSQNKKTLQIVLIVLIAVLTLGIGYASLSAINLIIDGNATANPNDNNFKVKFLYEKDVTPMIEGSPTNTVQVDSDTIASFNVSTLNGAGQSVTATYRVKNESPGIGASIGLQLTNSNPDYFQVTQKILDNKLQAGEETTVTVKVEMLKTPVTAAVSTNITATLIATPIEDAEASGGDPQEEIVPKPISYVYTVNNGDNHTLINQAIPNGVNQYNSFNNPDRTAFGHPTSLAHILEGGLIKESYVAFEKDNKVYYLRGGAGDEFGQASMPIYDANVAVLKEAFGPTWSYYCSEDVGGDYRSFHCSAGDFDANAGADALDAYANTNGLVAFGGVAWDCNVGADGGSSCNS